MGSPAKTMSSLLLAIGSLVLISASILEAVEPISCGDAVRALIPCETFLLGSSLPPPSQDCCSSAQQLEAMADTTEKRRGLCQCFEQTAPSFGVKPERVASLPSYCQLNVTFPSDPHYDCSKIP